MYPVLLKIGPVPIHTYGFMMAVAFLVCVYLMQRDAIKVGLDPKVFADTALYSLPLGILGARLAFIMMYPGEFSLSDPIGWIALWRGGLVFQGAPRFCNSVCLLLSAQAQGFLLARGGHHHAVHSAWTRHRADRVFFLRMLLRDLDRGPVGHPISAYSR